MGFFDKIFGKDETGNTNSRSLKSDSFDTGYTPNNDPDIMFGHYVDANKNAYQLARWDEANSYFKQKNFKDSFTAFLDYLGDKEAKNLSWRYQGSDIHFTLEQGSKQVKGIHNGEYIMAETPLAEFEQPPIAVMRQLLTANYTLRYNKFAIHENKFGIYFKSQAREASPTKLYHALKELALKADKNDDFLTEEFAGLSPVGTGHIPKKDPRITEVKYTYWVQWSEETLRFVNSLDKNSFSGIVAYALLNLCYKTDYLLAPQGHFMDELTRIQHIYWNKQDVRSTVEKNDDIIRNLKQLMTKPKEYFTESFYSVKATFGLAVAAGAQTVADYITDCLKNTDWYVQNRYSNMETIIYEYTTSYCLFHFGMYPVHYKLMNLHMQIMHEAYFRELGFAVPYIQNGLLQPDAITGEINRIIASEKADYKNLSFLTANLKFNSLPEFHYSFLSEIRFLNFAK